MANHKSALKRIRQTAKRTARNKDALSRMRTFIKKVDEAVTSGNAEEAKNAFRTAESELAVAAKKGIIHKNQAARRVSRLNARVKGMAAS